MSFRAFGRYRRAMRMMAASLVLGFIGLGCRHAAPQEPSKPAVVVPRPPEIKATNSDSGLMMLWQVQMNQASAEVARKNYARAALLCAEALKTAGQFGPGDARLTTNLVYLAGIYQTENKSDLAEQTFKEAVTSREQAVGTNDPSLVMPLDTLANFYYFAERRYDLATPLCLRILQLVENASPRDDAEVEKRARAVAAVYRVQGQYAQAEP